MPASTSIARRPRRSARRRRRGGGRRAGGARRAGQRHAQRLGGDWPSCWRCTCRRRRPRPGRSPARSRSTSSRVICPAQARPDRLERVDDGDVAAVELARQRRAGVEEHRGDVEPGGGHQHAGQRLVAAGQQHGAVESLGAEHRLDRVGDDLAGDQRVVHAARGPSRCRRRPRWCRTPAGSRRRRARPPSPPCASRSSDRLHGVISFHDDATPICGLRQSSSPMPTARSMPRAAARSRPSVTMRLCGLRCCLRFPAEPGCSLVTPKTLRRRFGSCPRSRLVRCSGCPGWPIW